MTADADVLIAEEIKKYLGKTLDDVIASTYEDEKRKKLRNAQGMIESNGFKMSCVAEAKMEFINETLSKQLDTNIKLIGFSNGVYDLDQNTFRKGTVEDKVSMTTRYNFSEMTLTMKKWNLLTK